MGCSRTPLTDYKLKMEPVMKKKLEKLRLSTNKLCCTPKLGFYDGKSTDEIDVKQKSFFQKRGFETLEFGLTIAKKGFNIFVAGESGTGKTSNVKNYLEEVARDMSTPDDLCYVFNFENPDEPGLITLPPGEGENLVKDMQDLLEYFQYQIPRQLESESFEMKKGEIARWYQEESEKNYVEAERDASTLGFALKSTQSGLVINPVVDEKSLGKEEFDKLNETQKDEIRRNEEKLQDKLIAYFHKERVLEKEYKEKMTSLRQNMVKLIIADPVSELSKKYMGNESMKRYMDGLENHILEKFDDFFLNRDIEEGKVDASKYEVPDFKEYRVNLIINNKNLKGAPVIYETNPTFQNIMGYFEYEERYGSLFTDFLKMKPGALHKANGGFLIIQANDILKNYYAWTSLKRALRNKLLKMDDLDIDFRYRVNFTPKPEAVPLNIKVVMIGDDYTYHLLYNYDDDFKRIFRVKADFGSTIDVNAANTRILVEFISRVVKEDQMLPFDSEAIRKVLYYCSRFAEDQKKYRVRATDIVDILVEADFWARKERHSMVTGDQIRKAIAYKENRHARVKERYYESIERGSILIDVDGEDVGQINGLAVYSIGDFSFGIPSRITARVFAGRRGIINIDREVRLSGAIHDKGAMILAGYLGDLFAQNKHMSLSASIAFEQSYGGVEGDSASSTELYALLSALADAPIRQGIAVTGSINQMGDIQPIGGVNEKVEGFFDICNIRGLTGDQGAIIPVQNVENLNLREDVIAAVEEGKFSIYAIHNVREGIEILTGIKAGNRRKDGTFTPDSIFDRADKKIRQLNSVK